MEIISYLKGKKAQKEIEELHKVVGQDQFKHGVRDVVDTFTNAHERISRLEDQNKDRELSKKIESITEKTAIELQKNALRVGSFQNANRHKHTQLVFDGFKDTTGIQNSKSINVTHVPVSNKIIQTSNSLDSQITLIPEVMANEMNYIIVETTHSKANGKTISLSFDKIASFENTLVENGSLKLSKRMEDQYGYPFFYDKGHAIFEDVFFEEEVVIKSWAANNNNTPSQFKLFAATSENGTSFSSYKEIAPNSKISNYTRFKLELYGVEDSLTYVGPLNNFTGEQISLTEAKELSPKNNYILEGVKDSSWTDEGSLHRKKITRDEWLRIDRLNVGRIKQ